MADSKRLSAEERLKKIEQKRSRLADEAAKIRASQRKNEANIKIKLGGLVWKAGLKDEADNVILGILVLGFQTMVNNRAAFEEAGCKKFDDDAKTKAKAKAEAKPAAPSQPAVPQAGARYLNVPIEEKDEAKALGAKWDPVLKKWFCNPDDIAKFTKWLPK